MILVTGGTGFLGGHLLDQLIAAGTEVRVLCRRPPAELSDRFARLQVALGDITNPGSLASAFAGVNQVFHIAGMVNFRPWSLRRLLAVNEQGTRNVMEACLRARVSRVVHVSSVSAIGAAADPARPLCETDFGRGAGLNLPYPQSKLRGEQVALEYADKGLNVVVVNPTFFIGPGNVNLSSARTVVSFLRRQVWVGLTTGGFGMTDVRNVAKGMMLAMERGRAKQRYILGGHNLRLPQYHALLAELTGLAAPRIRVPPAIAMVLAVFAKIGYGVLGIKTYVGIGDVRLARHYWMFDYARARDELGLVCRSPMESLHDTLRWLQEVGYYKPRV